MNIFINYVGNIEFYKDKKGFTDKEMCDKAGISLSSYNDMKKRNSFSTKNLEKIAIALGVQVSDLVKDRNVNEKEKALRDFEEIKKKLDEFEEKHLK